MKTKFLCLFFVMVLILSILPILAEEVINLNQNSDVITLNSNPERFNLFDFFRNLFKIWKKPRAELVLLDKKEQADLDFLNTENDNNVEEILRINSLNTKSSSSRSSRKSSSSSSRASSSSENSDSRDVVVEENENLEISSVVDTTGLDDSAEASFEVKSSDSNMQIMIIVDPDRIRFSPPLLSSVCVGSSGNEEIDMRVLGDLYPSLNYNGRVACLFADSFRADMELEIMESDYLKDDLIASKTSYISIDCDDLHVDYSYVFENIDLSSQFVSPHDTGKIEIYALVKLTSDYTHNLEYSTSEYDVYKESDCECFSGSCCDTSSRPYEFESLGTSCALCGECNSKGSCLTSGDDTSCETIDCSRWYIQTGTQRPTSTEYCYNKKDITSNRCEAFGNCKDSNTADCSSQSNDQLKYSCGICKYIRTEVCTGTILGSCRNYAEGVSCGINVECDGNGNCVSSCSSHDSSKCYGGDVYWYDSCNVRESKREECGSLNCVGGKCQPSITCTDSDGGLVYYVKGTARGPNGVFTDSCVEEGGSVLREFFCSLDERVVYLRYTCPGGNICSDGACIGVCVAETCASLGYECGTQDDGCGGTLDCDVCPSGEICSNGECVEEPSIINCSSNAECGADGWADDRDCFLGDVWQTYTQYICHNPGTISSYCEKQDANQPREDCLYGCENAECLDQPYLMPDLTVTDFKNYLIRDKEVFVSFTIKNIGEVPADEVYWMIDTDSDDENPKRTSPINLDTGEWTRAFMKIVYLHPGTYFPKVIVDQDNIVSETDENNNENSIFITV